MVLDLVNYLVAGAAGFVLGVLTGNLRREVHQIKEAVVDHDQKAEKPDEPDHRRRWRILGFFIAVVALGQLGYTVYDSHERNEKTQCLADYVSDFSTVNTVRSNIAAVDRAVELQNRRELQKLLSGFETEREEDQALADYKGFLDDSIAGSERREVRRENNPSPVLERRDCG